MSIVERAAPWWPAVDALRGVAVAAVLLYHHDADLLPGGFLGVSLFFTLSGFLITTLVLREHERSGTISLARFWGRRARRLAPVALLGLVLALGVAAGTAPDSEQREIGGDVAAAALNVANWRQAVDEVGYGDTMTAPSPVAHYWSLAIEEQFYVVFPVVALLALRRGRRTLGAVLGFAVVASLAARLAIDDPNRIYLGTDTRAAELAIGGLLAVGWKGWQRTPATRRRLPWLDVAAVAAAAVLLLSWRLVELTDRAVVDGGLAVHAVLTAVVVAAAVAGRWLPALGRVRPLVELGKLSYAVYVVHFPLYQWLDGSGLAVRLAATGIAAGLVHLVVERPVRFGGAFRAPRQAPLALATAIAAVVVLSTGVPRAVDRGDSVLAAAGLPTVVTMPDPATSSTAGATATSAPTSTSVAIESPVPTSSGETGGAPHAATPPTGAPQPTAPPPPPAPPRLLVVGDSTALATGAGMQQWAAETGAAAVDLVAHFGCTFLQSGQLRVRDGWVQPQSPECLALLDTAVRVAAVNPPDAIVLFIGAIQLADWDLDSDGVWRSVGEPGYDARYLTAAGAGLDVLASVGVPVLWADLPVPEWAPEVSGGFLPGQGAPYINDVNRRDRLAALDAQLDAARPAVTIVPYERFLVDGSGRIPASVRPDGLHVAATAVPGVMAAGFADTLLAALGR